MRRVILEHVGTKDILLTSIALAAGALSSAPTLRSVIVGLGVLGAVSSGAVLWWDAINRARGTRRRAALFTALREPDREATMFAAKKGWNAGAVIGQVIEIWSHDSLDTMMPLCDIGVAPADLAFMQPNPGNFVDVLARCGGLKSFPPPNSPKFGIRHLPLGTKDDRDYTIQFFSTDWNTWMSARTVIEKDPNLRWEFSDVIPEQNRLPQSMSLQFLVRFRNGDILVLRRAQGLASAENKWSFSGEEQISEEDFRATGVPVAEYLFRRAFIEEVFGHRGNDPDHKKRIWEDDCAPIVTSHQVWSFFLEENTGIFQTFGVYQLNIDAQQLRAMRERAVSAGWGADDHEGLWYTVSEADLAHLLEEGSCSAVRLHGTADSASINRNCLHGTSRYRLWRLYRALSRRGETLTSLHLPAIS